MVRPEPHQPLGKSDFGEQRGVEPRPDLFEKVLPFGSRSGVNLRRGGRLRGLGHLAGLFAHALALLGGEPLGFLLGALRENILRLPRRACFEAGTRGLRARQQVGIVDGAGAWTFQLGQQRTARV